MMGLMPRAKADPFELEAQFIKVHEGARQSVVMITTKHSKGSRGVNRMAVPPDADRGGAPYVPGFVSATYSGVVYDASGRILTVASAVQNADEVEVTTWDGRRQKADLLGADDRTGIGVLKVSDPALKPLPVLDSSELKVGSVVLVIGNSFGLRGSMSYGMVSGLNRRIQGNDGALKGIIQITAPINPGDAGGAVLDLRGRLVGLVHSTFGRAPSLESLMYMTGEGRQMIGWGAPESPMSAEGINFAMPIGEVKPMADEIIKSGAVTRGWVGMRIEGVAGGVRVSDVLPESPAEKAGIQAGDRLVAVNGQAVKDVDDVVDLISHSAIGSPLQIGVDRGGRNLTLSVAVAQQPRTEEAYESLLKDMSPLMGHGGRLGVLVQDLTPEMAEYLKAPAAGALVVSVAARSPAERSGFRSHDVVVSVDGRTVQSAGELRRAMATCKADSPVRVELYRDGAKMSIDVRLGQ
jgi:serine protease Do